jgi:uncharacterized protein (DUF305 family)
MQTLQTNLLRHRARPLGAILCLCLAGTYAVAHEGHHHGQMPSDAPTATPTVGTPPVFIASSAKSFADLMSDAMAVMHDGMQRAPINGQVDHDFVTMMIPHHQGAVDMAKAVLLYTHDPEIRNMALGFIAEQQNEINVMQAWLKHHSSEATR